MRESSQDAGHIVNYSPAIPADDSLQADVRELAAVYNFLNNVQVDSGAIQVDHLVSLALRLKELQSKAVLTVAKLVTQAGCSQQFV